MVAAAGGALLLGVGLAAALWLPTFELARRSARWGLASVTREYWSLHPLMLGQLGLPVFLVDLPIRPEWRAMLFEGREPFLESFYLGLSTLGLVTAALVARRGQAGFLAALAALAIAAALGRHTFVYGLLVNTVPGVSFLRYPQKAMIVTALLTALLAGLGYDALRRPDTWADRRRRRILIAILGVLAAIGVAATLIAFLGADAVGTGLFLPPAQAGAPPDVLLRPIALSLATAAAAAVVLLLAALLTGAGRLPPKRLAVLAGLVVIADLVVANRDVNPTAPRDLVHFRSPVLETLRPSLNVRALTYDYNAVPNSAERYLGRHVATLVEVQPRGWSYRASVALGLQSYLPAPMGARYGLFGSFDGDPRGLYPAPLDGLVRLFWSLDERPSERLRMLQLAGVTHVVALHANGFESLTEVARHPSLFAEPIRVFQVPDPAPRTYVVSGARPEATGPAALLDPGFDFRTEVLVPGTAVRPPIPGFRGKLADHRLCPGSRGAGGRALAPRVRRDDRHRRSGLARADRRRAGAGADRQRRLPGGGGPGGAAPDRDVVLAPSSHRGPRGGAPLVGDCRGRVLPGAARGACLIRAPRSPRPGRGGQSCRLRLAELHGQVHRPALALHSDRRVAPLGGVRGGPRGGRPPSFTAFPATRTMTSPALIPALPAGPSSSTSVTSTPPSTLKYRASWSPSSWYERPSLRPWPADPWPQSVEGRGHGGYGRRGQVSQIREFRHLEVEVLAQPAGAEGEHVVTVRLRQRDGQLLDGPAAAHLEVDGPAGGRLAHQARELGRAPDVLAAEAHDHVAVLDPRLLGGRARPGRP